MRLVVDCRPRPNGRATFVPPRPSAISMTLRDSAASPNTNGGGQPVPHIAGSPRVIQVRSLPNHVPDRRHWWCRRGESPRQRFHRRCARVPALRLDLDANQAVVANTVSLLEEANRLCIFLHLIKAEEIHRICTEDNLRRVRFPSIGRDRDSVLQKSRSSSDID